MKKITGIALLILSLVCLWLSAYLGYRMEVFSDADPKWFAFPFVLTSSIAFFTPLIFGCITLGDD